MAGYPSSQPAWQQTELNNLASQGLLSGINPLVLSGVAQNESGFENAGPGINSSGYGGFYGLGQNSTYGFGGQSFTETPGILMDPGVSSFDQQSQAAAAEIAHLMAANGGDLQSALAAYTGGGPTNGDYLLAMQDLGGASPTSTGIGGFPAVTGSGGAAPSGGTTMATTTAFGGSLNPANWPGEVINALKPWVARIVLVIVALILLKVGLDHLMDTDKTPAGIIVDSLPSGGGGKGMQSPGAQAPQSGGGESQEQTPTDTKEEESADKHTEEEGGTEHKGEEGAEDAAEEAPEAAAAA